MSYFIILLVIAVALAPLSHFVPSKAQRKTARLREYAAISGLFVEFRDLPDPSLKGRGREFSQTIYYGKRISYRLEGPAKRLAFAKHSGEWRSVGPRTTIPECLVALPEAISAVSADQISCGVYWQEAGDEVEIDQICVVLDQIIDAIYHH